MKATRLFSILLPLVLMIVSCSKTGDVSGDVFILRGNQSVRGAGVEILIVPASDRLEAEIQRMIRDYDQEYGESIRRDEAECKKAAAVREKIEADPALQKKIDEDAKARFAEMKKSLKMKKGHGSYSDRRLAEAVRIEAELILVGQMGGGNCPFARRDRKTELGQFLRASIQDSTPASQLKTVLADANGHYEVSGLPVGRYYIAATMNPEQRWLDPVHWLVAVQIASGVQKVHLSNANSGPLLFLTKTPGPE